MKKEYCIPGSEYSCPYLPRCKDEGKYSVMILKVPLNSFNSKIRKHFTWKKYGKNITCLLRIIQSKNSLDLNEELETDFEEVEAFFEMKKRV
jgi:hypothetical protein